MGQSEVKATIPSHSNYGLTTYEQIMLQEYFNVSAAIDRRRFNGLFAVMNPDAVGPYFQYLADKAFIEADTNRDGYISFQEFVQAYLTSKRVKEEMEKFDRTLRKRRLFPY